MKTQERKREFVKMEMDFEKSKVMLEGMGPPPSTPTFPQPVAFPAVDFSAFSPFAMGFPAANLQAALFQNALATMQSYMAPMQALMPMGEVPALNPLFMLPTPNSLPTPPLAESTGFSQAPAESSDVPFDITDDLLSFDLGSPGSVALSLPSPNQMAPTPVSTMSTPGGGKEKKRKSKPRMAELSESDAQAKRDSNRESARKSRDRKRLRERNALDENERLRNEVAKLQVKVQVLSDLLREKTNV